MKQLLALSNSTLFLYYLLSNIFYLLLLVAAWITNLRHRRRIAGLRLETLEKSPFTPPISILVPARNEQGGIVNSVRSLLALDYPELEVIVINDGSTDGTLLELHEAFALRPANLLYVARVRSAPVRALYASDWEARLLVVDKVGIGTKSDAINAGLNAATSPYICIIDADSILEKDALLRLMAQIFSEPVPMLAAGGIVRILNGNQVDNGAITAIRLPRRPVEALQVVEYLRAFFIGREAWGCLNLLPIISGAFGLFRRDLLLEVGGYRARAIGEDMDVVVRMHRRLLERSESYRIGFVPEPTCWTQVPSTLRALARQRARWQKGLLDVLWPNRDMLFRPRYRLVGSIVLPYLWIFELLAPVIEVVGYSTILIAALAGMLSRTFLVQFAIFGYAFATMLSIGSVVQEELTARRYNNWTDVARLLLYCFLEHFPYRQINMLWRLQGMWQYLQGRVTWERDVGAELKPSLSRRRP